MTLEVEFKKQEQKRRESKKLKSLIKQGIPFTDLATEVQEQVRQIQQHFGSIEVEAKQFLEPMNNLLKLLQQRVTFFEDLKVFGGQIGWVTDTLTVIAKNVQSASAKMDKVFNELTADLVERGKLRAKQMETLAKIDDYLERWG